ncbi:AP-2 complex subunit sigma [Candida viswanathii]|uniref:AP complex subunit sigma n=1 Tax=Candida viswanathii TaxID=5486 RepID=A0A367YCJ8_9ASCO|nr:AP-2 complex subunit sigma [Candida viswanathii]RCK63946.1 AP-2 complex subunit sigma [Candida viswanathii]
MSIHFILVLNRQGKSRLVKWYDNSYTPQQKQQYVADIHRLISSRDSKHQSNFVEFQQQKLVYRRYAGLYFISAIDLVDSELSYLESLHFFVEILDVYFNSVCEVDLVFNFYKLYFILDEIYLGGEIQEILKKKILERLKFLDDMD